MDKVDIPYIYIYIYIYIYKICIYGSPFHLATAQSLWLIGRDGGLSTLCHSYGFACQQRVLKFPGPGYLRSKDGVVQLCHLLVNLCIYIYIYIYTHTYAIMKSMCPPRYHHNGPVATHALGHMMHSLMLMYMMYMCPSA